MDESVQHEMELKATHSTGAEEWYCPTCGRRLIMQWPPHYKKIVLEPGDENAPHTGAKGGLRIGAVQLGASKQTESSEEPDLSRWEAWLEDVDLDDKELQ